MQIEQAVILAGGRGSRLRPLTDTLPKPMAPINDVPFLAYLLEQLKSYSVDWLQRTFNQRVFCKW